MDAQRILSNLLRLAEVPSVTGTAGENQMVGLLREMLLEMDFFRDHRERVRVHPTKNDPHNRRFITALLPGGVESRETVVLLSHLDVVGVDEFGELKGYAFKPREYTEKLREARLTPEVTADLESGDYLFGRGVLDMKFGISLHLEILRQAALKRDHLRGNLLFLAVPDEEGNSTGMLSAVPELLRLKRGGLDFVGAINSEPFFPRCPGDSAGCLYTGTVGKLLLFVFCAGQSTHAGSPFAGLNVNLLLCRIVELLELNADLAECREGASSPPPVCLKMSDLRQEYSVQTPDCAYAYFNLTTLGRNPVETLALVKEVARKASLETTRLIEGRAARYAEITGTDAAVSSCEPEVYTFAEFLNRCSLTTGQETERLLEEANQRVVSRDLQEATVEYFRALHDMSGMNHPLVVIGFAPPYYPHSLLGDTPGEARVRRVVDRVIERARERHGEDMLHVPFFPGLSDMSYLKLGGEPAATGVAENTPLWGRKYRVPLREIAELDVPFINLGPRGRDLHKATERLHLPYSLRVTADLANFAALSLLSGVIDKSGCEAEP